MMQYEGSLALPAPLTGHAKTFAARFTKVRRGPDPPFKSGTDRGRGGAALAYMEGGESSPPSIAVVDWRVSTLDQ
jgi:hypothetical protein